MRARKQILNILAMVAVLLACGCTPRIVVRAHPGPSDTGVRYYRPKPYLKVEPAEIAVDKSKSTIVPGLVRISLVYLPDFSEEYSIDVRTGFGTADVGIKLQDGWNLTEISQDLDSQTDENLRAVGEVLSAVGGIVPTAETSAQAAFTVPSRNVPLGFYEGVIGRDERGVKRLYGFRYLGFMPYASCPMEVSGHSHACCGDPLHMLYGLAFENGEMVFSPLDSMATGPRVSATSPTPAAAEEVQPESPPLPLPDAQLSIALRSYLQQINDGVAEVRVAELAGRWVVEIVVAKGVPVMEVRIATEDWLRDRNLGPESDVRIVEAQF